jgi:hypothetical protein
VLQFLYLPGKLVVDVLRSWIERVGRQLIRAGGAADAQVNAARGDRFEDTELLGDFQR